MQPNLVKIGKLTRLHGIKGALVLHVGTGDAPVFKKNGAFFITINGVPTPFFPESIKQSGKHLIVSFDTVKDSAAAAKLLNLEVFVEKKTLVAQKKENDLTGYTLVDKEKGALGVIREIIELPGQRMFSILFEGKEVLLPFTPEFITRTEATSKTVYYEAPEGLIDIYLG